jgi:hypothetical protein
MIVGLLLWQSWTALCGKDIGMLALGQHILTWQAVVGHTM